MHIVLVFAAVAAESNPVPADIQSSAQQTVSS
jgi:hypothetical protein